MRVSISSIVGVAACCALVAIFAQSNQDQGGGTSYVQPSRVYSSSFRITPGLVSSQADWTTNVAWSLAVTNAVYAINRTVHTESIVVEALCTNAGTLIVSYMNTSAAPLTPAEQSMVVYEFVR